MKTAPPRQASKEVSVKACPAPSAALVNTKKPMSPPKAEPAIKPRRTG